MFQSVCSVPLCRYKWFCIYIKTCTVHSHHPCTYPKICTLISEGDRPPVELFIICICVRTRAFDVYCTSVCLRPEPQSLTCFVLITNIWGLGKERSIVFRRWNRRCSCLRWNLGLGLHGRWFLSLTMHECAVKLSTCSLHGVTWRSDEDAGVRRR